MASSIRHDWYQTEEKVVITVLIKNAAERNCSVDIERNSVSVKCDDNINLKFDLLHEINPTECTYKISSMKIEINLRKIVGARWETLIKSTESATNVSQPNTISSLHSSQSKNEPTTVDLAAAKAKEKNWDKLVQDIYEEEDLEKVIYLITLIVYFMELKFICI